MCIREGITVLKRISVFLSCFKLRFTSDLLLLVVLYRKHLFFNTTYHSAKETIDNMLTDRWTSVNPEFYFRYDFANQYALLWTHNAYRNMLMRIFTPCLFFQSFFTNFQCVITLLRALSVALWMAYNLKYIPGCFFTRTSLLKTSNNLEPKCDIWISKVPDLLFLGIYQ